MKSRRTFLLKLLPATGLLALGLPQVCAAGPEKVAETDPNAISLGYQADATKVDKTKSKTYVAGQSCSTCQLFQGKPADAWGPCAVMQGKLVSSKGWCRAWVKRAA